jgi:hypothetical protein
MDDLGLDPSSNEADSGEGKRAEHLYDPRPLRDGGRCISVAGERKTVSHAPADGKMAEASGDARQGGPGIEEGEDDHD